MLRIVFMGSPEFAVPTLEALIAHPGCEVRAVVTQPDRPAGRGKQLAPPPVKLCAQAHGLTVYQPEKLKTQEMLDILTGIAPDFFVTIAYGKILRQAFLDIPRIAPLNLHASLLPAYRGAAPVQWAIMNGERETGVCLMRMDAGMDTGPVYARESVPILEDETPSSLFEKLSAVSARILMAHIFEIAEGRLEAVPQTGAPSLAPMLDKSMGLVDFDGDAHRTACRIRGLSGWPGAYAYFQGKRIVIHDARVVEGHCEDAPGTVIGLGEDNALLVSCRSGMIGIRTIQVEGKKKTDALGFLNGYRPVGEKLTVVPEA